jgi:hypothetical protein
MPVVRLLVQYRLAPELQLRGLSQSLGTMAGVVLSRRPEGSAAGSARFPTVEA